jgi:CheY-like chemotaxis protein
MMERSRPADAHLTPGEEQGQAIHYASLADLAAGIAHEINNPLAIILEAAGWIGDLLDEEELKESPNADEIRRALRKITTQGGRCRDITRNLLSFARRTGVKLEQLQLNDLVRELEEAFTKRAQERRVEIVTELAPDLPAAQLPATEMQQVLTNLIGNAIDALQPDGGRIVIRTRRVEEELHLEVADTGPGIPPSVLPRIFEPFFTTKPVGKGTGLGLAVCAGIVSSLGGAIGVESGPERGTTFHVTLPLQPAAEPGLRLPAAIDRREPEPAAGRGGKPALVAVVDDETEFSEVLCQRLKHRGVATLQAASRADALDLLGGNRSIDVVLLNVAMRGVDGIALLAEIRRACPGLEVILLAAHSSAETAIAALKLGAFDYLIKPCETRQLLDRIARARARKQKWEQDELEAKLLDITSRRV